MNDCCIKLALTDSNNSKLVEERFLAGWGWPTQRQSSMHVCATGTTTTKAYLYRKKSCAGKPVRRIRSRHIVIRSLWTDVVGTMQKLTFITVTVNTITQLNNASVGDASGFFPSFCSHSCISMQSKNVRTQSRWMWETNSIHVVSFPATLTNSHTHESQHQNLWVWWSAVTPSWPQRDWRAVSGCQRCGERAAEIISRTEHVHQSSCSQNFLFCDYKHQQDLFHEINRWYSKVTVCVIKDTFCSCLSLRSFSFFWVK